SVRRRIEEEEIVQAGGRAIASSDEGSEGSLRSPPSILGPAKLLHRQAGVPDLRHVPDFVSVEVHNVHVVGFHALAGGWARTTRASVRAQKDTVRGDVLAVGIGSKGLQLVAAIWDEG